MKILLKNICKYGLIASFSALIVFLIFYGQMLTHSYPPQDELNATAASANYYSLTKKQAINRSRDSSVRVLSFDVIEGIVSTSSATYFKYKDEYFILTTNHGLLGNCDSVQIEADGELYNCEEIIAADLLVDYAIIRVGEVKNRKPIIFPQHTIRGIHKWNKSLTLLNEIVYTGYPNGIGPLTLGGKIMGFDSHGMIFVDSYAWSGSSGSGVFDRNGHLMGYILAIDVGNSEYGAAILENVMLVVPIYKVDWSVIFVRG
jgi:hypothetical protein